MIVTGTGVSGDTAYAIAADALAAYGHPACYVNFPDETTADIQISVQYLVNGLRREYAMAGRKVAVFGISQGGLLPAVRAHLLERPAAQGQRRPRGRRDPARNERRLRLHAPSMPCSPAEWQQIKGSKLLGAINGQPDETPGKTSYTTVRSLTDETVQPQGGKHPTSSLDGASNILIQDVCPGRADEPHRQRGRLGLVRRVRRRDRAQGAGRPRAVPGRRLRPPASAPDSTR